MAADGKGVAWIQTLGVLGAAAIAAGAAYWQQHRDPPPGGGTEAIVATGPPVMGQFQVGVNLQGLDFDDHGISTPNAADCAEQCRVDDRCRAMTYVVSLQTCWLKKGVPDPFPPGGPDYISAKKQ